MSTSYVIVDRDWQTALKAAVNLCSVRKSKDDSIYRLQMNTPKGYGIQKRMALSRFANVPGDDVQQVSDISTVFLMETEDTENTWLFGTATSVSSPEIILDALSEALDTHWYSEHDDEYWIISDEVNDEIRDDDLPDL